MRTRSSNSSLESLPSELFFAIAEHANFETRLALSTTNSKCRTLLLPTIFRTLKVTSNENEANEVLAFAKKAGANVRGISFYGTAKPNADENVDADKDADADENIGAEEDAGAFQRDQQSKEGRLSHKEQILPLAAAELLSGQHLPNMTTLTINFDFDFDNGNCSGTWDSRDDLCDGTSMYAFTVPETDKNMVDDSEAEFPWRKLMAQTWAAVSQNKYVTELIVKDLIPKAVSPWFSPPWEHFLAQILVADIQIWGGDNGAGWEVGTLDGYMYFVSQMGQYFFQHMKKTKKFRLACYEHGPLGSQWAGLEIDLNTMSLRPDCLPELEQLRLEYVLICPGLVEFLKPKTALKSVDLHECFASSEYSNIRFTWADFFSGIRKSGPQWTGFNITNNATPPLTFEEWQATKHPEEKAQQTDTNQEAESDEVKNVRAELAKDPNRRLFLYGTLTDKYGDRWPDEDCIIEQFQAGRDMSEFEKLVDHIAKNTR